MVSRAWNQRLVGDLDPQAARRPPPDDQHVNAPPVEATMALGMVDPASLNVSPPSSATAT